MSRKDMKNFKTYREAHLKVENEPEEGEIVDDYDLIVSSDEELSMRQRIRELEAENEEIEQIAVISRSYVDKINHLHNNLETSRAAQVPTDASSISSTEFVTPKKRKRRKSREHKRKHCHHQHQQNHQYEQHSRYDQQEMPLKTRSRKSHCKRRQKLLAKKNQKKNSDRHAHKEINAEVLSLESYDSSDSSSSLTDTESYNKSWMALNKRDDTFNYDKYISRDTLRLAVARNSNEPKISTKKSCLKDKLLRQELVGQATIIATDERHEEDEVNEINDDDDDDVQVVENEPDIQTVDEDSTDSMEEKELRLIALKSAVLKKHMARKVRNAESAYSPTDFDKMLSSGILREENKMNDIDVVDLEAEDFQTAGLTVSPEASPQLMMLDDESQPMVDCKPIDMDIVNSDSEDATADSWSKEVKNALPTFSLVPHDFTNNVQYGYYMQDLHELPPPPPGVDDYEDIPPPPPYHMLFNAEMQDMDLDNEELAEVKHQKDTLKIDNIGNEHANPEKLLDFEESACHKEKVEDEEQEEEEALRALLLSKFQSPKYQKKTKRPIEVTECQDIWNKSEIFEHSNNKPKPTEFILKEAVKRLKIHTLTEHSNEDRNQTKKEETSENYSDSSNLLEKLRNRLYKYKSRSQSANSDRFQKETNENFSEQNVDSEVPATKPDNNACTIENSLELSYPSEITSTIDISDITRRLQIIKENVLNSTNKLKFNGSPNSVDSVLQAKDVSKTPSDISDVMEDVTLESKSQTPLVTIPQLNKQLINVVNTVPANSELNITLSKDKTVKANFDVNTNQTTFKVTITNKAALKSEENDIKDTLDDISHKENNADNVPKNLPSKIVNVNTKSKAPLISERFVKIINKSTDSNPGSKAQVNNSSFVVKPKMANTKTTAPSTYSFLRSTKIVKPNKVINTNFDLNRKQVSTESTESALVPNLSRPETINKLPSSSDNSRLITSIDQVKHMWKVAPFIISIQNSSNESSEDEWGEGNDCLYKPLYDYNDNASPLSLNLESPSRTPLRSNSPTDHDTDIISKPRNLEALTLNTKKTFVQIENQVDKTSETILANQGEKINSTPVAVRHLPAAAQGEYRRLVHRMQLLENKRKSAKVQENTIDGNTNTNSNDSLNSTPKTTLVKKVLIKNASNNTTTNKNDLKASNRPSSSYKFNKGNVLRSYETLYVKFGAGIVNNLDKSLKLVEEAKKAKISKLKLENRLKELKAEMDILQAKHKEEQQKISRIYPSICTTNDVITSLKQKRSKVFKAALDLGKTLKGEDFRLNNDLKECITAKSKLLATEIKVVNSLKAHDIANVDGPMKANLTAENLTDSKKKIIEDCKEKALRENIDTKLNSNAATKSAEKGIEHEEKTELDPPLNSEIGGNTEFQKLKSHHSKNENNPVETCRSELDKKIKNTEKDSKQALSSYISPLEHLRNIDSDMDPNGVICPYDLMGNCEDVTCKYVHITSKANT